MFQYFEWYGPADGSLWDDLASRAEALKDAGVTAVWTPPACKGLGGDEDQGYGVYDLYDLGAFDQKGSVRTRYGTEAQFLAAVHAVQGAGIHVYADVVLNHRMGGDELEEVEVEQIDWDDRHEVISEPYRIQAWSHYTFPGRGEQYSPLKLHWYHFTAFGRDANAPDDHRIYRVVGKTFSTETSTEYGNYDYLIGASVDLAHPEMREELFRWGRWFVERTGVHGFRLDAIKHIAHSFMREWLEHVRAGFPDRELFAVGEYWSGQLDELLEYLDATERNMLLFDVPLHYRLAEASREGEGYDLRTIFDDTLVAREPDLAVTFVDNHDSQPGSSLESWVADWFKPHAYALILLRRAGYPCVFYGDYFGNDDPQHRLTSHRHLLDILLQARQEGMWGEQRDYLDEPDCIGWTWSGDADHAPMAVLLSTGGAAVKRMNAGGGGVMFRDITGHVEEAVTADEHGEAAFTCPPGNISVWRGER